MPNRLRWGVLSTARIARTLFVPGVRAASESEVLAVGSRSLELARAFAEELEIPRAYGSYDALLGDSEVDAIYIGLPNSLHTEWTIRAANAGKHVLCEKPLARTAADAERMLAACRAAGVLLMEAFMWRHHPQHAHVRALLESGAVGAPSFVRASFGYVINRRAEPLLVRPAHTGARADAAPRGGRLNTSSGSAGLNVRLDPLLEGGSLMDVGCYGVNAARWLFGSEPVGFAAQQHVDPRYGVEVSFGGVLRFADGQLAMVDSSFAHVGLNRYEIAGPEGRIVVDRAFRPDDAPGRIELYHGSEQRVESVPPANQFANEADHFARSIRAGTLLPPAEDGVAQARALESLYSAARAGS